MKTIFLRPAAVALAVLGGALAASLAQARAIGVPLDSEYLIFVVDTSGSMRRYEWDRVQQQIAETLDLYPAVEGIQVLNDEGNHLFVATPGEWLEDTPALRREILERLESWDAFSNSTPQRGIRRAIETYYDPDKRISVYVYSDDLATGSGSIAGIVREIEALNHDAAGDYRVRIHGVAFPVYFDATGEMGTGGDYAVLMHTVAQHNGGSFVALPSRRAVTAASAERTLIVVDASADMSGDQWDRAVAVVGSLVTELAAGSSYQVQVFNERSRAVSGGGAGDWLDADDTALRAALIGSLTATEPAGDANLAAAIAAINAAQPLADNVYLLVAGLPAAGPTPPAVTSVTERERYQNFLGASRAVNRDVPVNVLLFGADADSVAASAYWSMALATGGTMLAPAEDWR